MKHSIFVILASVLALVSCQQEESQKGTPKKKKKISFSTTIFRDGLDFVRLGDKLADLNLEELGFTEVGDSLEEAGGYMWLSRTLPVEDGQIILEGDFIDDRQFSEEKLGESLLNRIRISTPSFKTAEQISVGMSLEQLQKANGERKFFVTPLPRDGLVDLEDENGHIHYLIEADMTVFSVIMEQADPLSVIPSQNKIKYIVVM